MKHIFERFFEMSQVKWLFVLMLLNWLPSMLFAEQAVSDSNAYLKAKPEDLEWFTAARFGMFVHWNQVSQLGSEISWSRGEVRPGLPANDPYWGDMFNTNRQGIPVEIYDNLYKTFNPYKFNAREWVGIIKAAGMKYLIFTTKHHDGFCMFKSTLTDYDINSTPFARDICKELADACHEAGIRIGWYYSPPDWHHPDFYTEHHDNYIKYMHGQVRELLTNYGKIDVMWFDSLLGSPPEKMGSYEMFKMIRQLQPGILINNRLSLPGDFETPEQCVGEYNTDRPWESCITIGAQWGWKLEDEVKPLKECLRTLIWCAGGDGNLLLNIGPMPNGRIEPHQVDILKQMGDWLKEYGQTIYGTRGGPIVPTSWMTSTCNEKTIYLHILDWPVGKISIPQLPAKIVSYHLLSGGKVKLTQEKKCITIEVAPEDRRDIDTILVLEMDQKVQGPIIQPSGSLAFGKLVTASNSYGGADDTYAPARAFDDNSSTRWATDNGVGECWLQVDIGKAMPINSVKIAEYGIRVRDFAIEVRGDEKADWKTVLSGSQIGKNYNAEFEKVATRYVRLNIKKTLAPPSIYEFQIFQK
jgi:alpha-L-fucosidase